jgi:acyl carrier protein
MDEVKTEAILPPVAMSVKARRVNCHMTEATPGAFSTDQVDSASVGLLESARCCLDPTDACSVNTSIPITQGVVLMSDEVYEKVAAIIVDKLNADPSQIVMEARFREDLKADSLDLVELIMAFEEEFGGTISDEDAQKITTVGEAVDYLTKAGA